MNASNHSPKLARVLAGVAKDGDVKLAIHDPAAGYWTAYFTTELGALRVYHAYGGADTFGTRRIQRIEAGPLAGCYSLTTFQEGSR